MYLKHNHYISITLSAEDIGVTMQSVLYSLKCS